MDAPRAASFEHPAAQFQRQRHLLVFAAGHVDVLQKLPAALAGGNDALEECVKVVLFQRLHQARHARVLVVEVERTEDSPVRHPALEGRDGLFKVGLGDLTEHIAAQEARHLLHLHRDGRVVAGEVPMLAAGGHHRHRVALFREVVGDGFDDRVRILEIHGHKAAHRGGHLVQKPAGLSKVIVFGVLGDKRAVFGGNLSISKQRVKKRDQHDLKRRGGGKPAALEHGGSDHRIEAAHRLAQRLHARGDAADQGMRGFVFGGDGFELPKVHDEGLIIPLGVQRDDGVRPL